MTRKTGRRPPVIGLALGSGGARGWCHIGVLRGLAELGVKVDVVAGTSMGALVGAAFAGGQLDALEEWARGLTQRKLVSFLDPSLSRGGLVEARRIETMLGEIGLAERIEDLDLPFTAIATDMETGREVWLSKGPAHRAVRASAGIPGVMSPVRHDDRWLLDGGLVNPVPVSAARALGAEIIISVNPNARRHGRFWVAPEPRAVTDGWLGQILPQTLHGSLGIGARADRVVPPNYFDVLTAAIDVMTDTILRARVAGEPPHVQLNAHLSQMSVLELYRAEEAIAEGARIVRSNAALIREACDLD